MEILTKKINEPVHIKFGTDGWRAIIAQEFTVENVARVAEATAEWLGQRNANATLTLGYDCRFAGKLFAETVAKVMLAKGVKVNLCDGFVSTPMISLTTLETNSDLGIIITASHNPPEYNGFKLKGSYGGPLLPADVEAIEELIPAYSGFSDNKISLEIEKENCNLKMIDMEQMYIDKVKESFDLEAIKNSGLRLAYDAMYGSGQNVIRRILPDTILLHCDYNPSFMGQAPEPIHRNLLEFSELIKKDGKIDCGLVTDGDADRIGLYDNEGNFIDSHHIILLLVHYLHKYKGMNGKVCTAFSSTVKVKNLCDHYGLELDVVKIGFKYICEIMLKEDVLLGGEESGGIAIKGHIPERDGIWMGLVIWEFMAKSGKSLKELIQEVYDITGTFAFERIDLKLEESVKQRIISSCSDGEYKSFGEYEVTRTDNLDGFKYFFGEDRWLMIRPSGTEPVLRTYAEAPTQAEAFKILGIVHDVLLKG